MIIGILSPSLQWHFLLITIDIKNKLVGNNEGCGSIGRINFHLDKNVHAIIRCQLQILKGSPASPIYIDFEIGRSAALKDNGADFYFLFMGVPDSEIAGTRTNASKDSVK